MQKSKVGLPLRGNEGFYFCRMKLILLPCCRGSEGFQCYLHDKRLPLFMPGVSSIFSILSRYASARFKRILSLIERLKTIYNIPFLLFDIV